MRMLEGLTSGKKGGERGKIEEEGRKKRREEEEEGGKQWYMKISSSS